MLMLLTSLLLLPHLERLLRSESQHQQQQPMPYQLHYPEQRTLAPLTGLRCLRLPR